MPKGTRAMYDDDDMEDYDDDDYYEGDGYDEYVETPAQKPQKAALASQNSKKTNPAQATAAGASRLAQYLCDPPPLRPNGKLQKGVKAAKPGPSSKSTTFPVAPQASASADGTFDFSTPSPDDRVITARQSGGSLKEVKFPTPSHIPQPSPSSASSSTAAAAAASSAVPGSRITTTTTSSSSSSAAAASTSAALAAITLHDQHAPHPTHQPATSTSSSAPQAAAPQRQRRNLSEYVMEADLAREVAALHAKESAGGLHPLHLVVLGHVDAGKSTLMGRLLHDLGHVSEREAHKNLREATQVGKASFSWAWVLDERPEERSRGVTVDIALARFTTHRFNVTLLDAPGHRDFVPNMIGGASQADAALLLVDGSPGGFEAGFMDSGLEGGGQTKEHAQLARSLGVEQVAVVISKLDTCNYSQERFEEIRAQLLPFLKSCGFRESSLQWLPAVGPTGENLGQLPPTSPLAAWWRGPTVVGAVDNFTPRERVTGRPLRIPVSDVLRGKSGIATAGGKIEGGAVKVGGRVVVWPSGDTATVRALEVDGKPSSVAYAGNSVDITLAGLQDGNLGAGSMICHPDFPVVFASRFEARVLVLDIPVPLLKGQSVTVHAHTDRQSGHISALTSVLNPKTGVVSKARPRCLLKGQTAVVEVHLERGMCLEQYADYKALGRVALRDGGRTVAVGVLTQLLQ